MAIFNSFRRGLLALVLLTYSFATFASEMENIVVEINLAAAKYGVDPLLIAAIIKVESDFNPLALSAKGAQGLMQLMPQTQAEVNVQSAFSVSGNIDGGVKYFKKNMLRFNSIKDALWAYNAGPNRVITNQKPAETRKYIRQVLRFYSLLQLANQQMSMDLSE